MADASPVPTPPRPGWRRVVGPDGRDWDVMADWPADKCVTCWQPDGRHSLWCPGHRTPLL